MEFKYNHHLIKKGELCCQEILKEITGLKATAIKTGSITSLR
jgi:hypothetical protein